MKSRENTSKYIHSLYIAVKPLVHFLSASKRLEFIINLSGGEHYPSILMTILEGDCL